jgi:hypothetical protein
VCPFGTSLPVACPGILEGARVHVSTVLRQYLSGILALGITGGLCGAGLVSAQVPPAVSFLTPVQSDSGDELPADLELADFNGDGHLDLAVVTTQGSGKTTNFLLGDGAGRLLKDNTIATPYATGIASADLNGDGILDLMVTQSATKLASDGLCPGTQPGTLIYLGTGGNVPGFAFRTCVVANPSGYLNDATAGDFTGDGKLDLVVGDGGTRGLRVYPGVGDGTFLPAINASGGANLSVTGPLTAFDVNRDGRLDLLGQLTAGGLVTFLGNGSGLLTRTSSAVGTTALAQQSTKTIAVGDLDRDGDLDVVGVTRGALVLGGVQQNYFFSSRGTATGTAYTFGPDAHPLAGTTAGRLSIADLNKDGQKDAVVLDQDGSQAYVFLSRGDGTFADGPVLAVGNQPQFVATGDWNSDNWIDIAVVDRNPGAQSRTWLIQQVAGTGDDVSPSVAIASPTPGSSVQGTVTIAATANDASGVARVEFFRGGILVGSDTTDPFSVAWDTTLAANGPQTLTARAYDTVDNPGISAAVSVTVANVDTTPPAVSLTWPTAVVAHISGTVTLSATASDKGGVTLVEFWAGNTVVGSTNVAPYAFVWNTVGFPPGTYDVTAKATDANGNTGSSPVITLLVDQPPVVTVTLVDAVEATSPAGGTVSLSATASDPDTGDALAYQWEDSGVAIGAAPSILATLAPGPHSVLFRATDSHGVSTEDYLQVDVVDSIAPVLTVPANVAVEANASLGAIVTFAATASDAVDVSPLVACAPASGSLFPLGLVTVTCTATDDFLNTSSGQFTVTVLDTALPVVVAPAPATIAATEAGGARANVPTSAASLALKAFIEGATAADIADPTLLRLAPQANINGVLTDVNAATLLPTGSTALTFRYQDDSGNIGLAVSTVTVAAPVGGVVSQPNQAVVATDANGLPQALTVSFTTVSQPGLLTADTIVSPPAPPAGYGFSSPVFDVVSTALASPPFTVCVQGSGYSSYDRLLHFDAGAWIDVTATASATEICGVVSTLSPFAVSSPANNAPTADAGASQIVEATSPSGADVTLSGIGTDVDPGDTLIFEWREGTTLLATGASATIVLPLGAHTLTLTVTDSRGASTSANTNVIVQDTTAPTLTLPPNQLVEATSVAGSAVSFSASASDAVGGTVSVTCNPGTGTIFAMGTAAVSCSAADTAGNVATGSFSVTVSDTTPPAVSVSSPAAGGVRGVISLAAMAADLVGVARVEFYRDTTTAVGVDLTEPYELSWNTRSVADGAHTVTARACDARNNCLDSTVAVNVSNVSPVTGATLRTSVTTPAIYGTPIQFIATASGGISSLEYQFWRYSYPMGTWTIVRPYEPIPTYTWTPSSADAGTYIFAVWIRSTGAPGLYEAYADFGLLTVTSIPPATITSVTSSTSRATVGTPITWTAAATGGNAPLSYEFWRYCFASPGWVLAQPYGTSASHTWTPQAADIGTCYVRVRVRGNGAQVPYEAWGDASGVAVVGTNPIALTSLMAVPASSAPYGQEITWTATATGGNAPLSYQFWKYSYVLKAWQMVRDYAVDPTYRWTPSISDVGSYIVHVRARSNSATAYEAYRQTEPFSVTGSTPITISSFARANSSPALYGTPITWTVVAAGGQPQLSYEFWRNCQAAPGWVLGRAYSTDSSYTWTPTDADAGTCFVRVRARSQGSVAPYDAWKDAPSIMVIGANPITIASLDVAPGWTVFSGTQMNFSAVATGGVPTLQYQYWRYSYATGTWSMVRDYSDVASYAWTPSAGEVGQHVIHVRVRSAGKLAFEAYREARITVTAP